MVNFAGEDEQPYDDRHNTPTPLAPRPFSHKLNEAGQKVEAFKGSELSFAFPHNGGVFTRLGRADSSTFDSIDNVDLVVLQAHLEAAHSAVRRAIEADWRKG